MISSSLWCSCDCRCLHVRVVDVVLVRQTVVLYQYDVSIFVIVIQHLFVLGDLNEQNIYDTRNQINGRQYAVGIKSYVL